MRIPASHAVRAVLLAAGAVGAAGAQAAVTLASDAASGAGSVIRDETQQKDFLRLDLTTPYTYDEAAARLGPGTWGLTGAGSMLVTAALRRSRA